MKNFCNHLLIAILLVAASNSCAQTLEHLHLVSASRTTVGASNDLSVAYWGVVRSYHGIPYVWDVTKRLWKPLGDPFMGDSLTLESTRISTSGIIYDELSNGWITFSDDAGLNFARLPSPPGTLLPFPLTNLLLSPIGELFVLTRT